MLAFFFSGLLLVSSMASAQNFSAGNNFESQNIRGSLTVYCQSSQLQVAYFRCEQEILKPGDFDYFIGPKGINADKVELSVLRENGTKKVKSGKYDSAKGRSKERFNLWVDTLLQNPLLNLGTNKVSYHMTKSGNSVSKGEFEVFVNRVPTAICRPGTYTSNNPRDCDNGSIACSYYFQDENYCQD